MAIKIGHASADERYKASGGVAGDQTGGEVCVRAWYSSPWDMVLRFIDPDKGEKAAEAMEKACNNPAVGYDQSNRNDAAKKAEAAAWDMGAIIEPTECDCSSLVTVCAQCAGVVVPYVWGNAPYTGNMEQQFMSTGEFIKLTESRYLISDEYLRRGDILLRVSGHTAMALENGCMANDEAAASPRPTGTPGNEAVGRDDPGAPETIPQSSGATAPFTQGSQSGSEILMNTPLPLLKKGSKGQAVWSMQTLLSDRGYSTLGVDSDFGPNTDAALRRFQTAMGLELDGECGPKSWAALIGG